VIGTFYNEPHSPFYAEIFIYYYLKATLTTEDLCETTIQPLVMGSVKSMFSC